MLSHTICIPAGKHPRMKRRGMTANETQVHARLSSQASLPWCPTAIAMACRERTCMTFITMDRWSPWVQGVNLKIWI